MRYNKKRYGLRQPQHLFKQHVYLKDWIISSPIADTPINMSFSLGDLTNASEFTTLYDQWKLNGVKIELIPKYSQSNPVENAITTIVQQPNVHTVIDYDSSALLGMTDIVQYQNMKTTRGNAIHKRFLKPKVSYNILSATGASVRSPTTRAWIDCSATNVLYRGVLGTITSGNISCSYDLKMTYYLAFKNVR